MLADLRLGRGSDQRLLADARKAMRDLLAEADQLARALDCATEIGLSADRVARVAQAVAAARELLRLASYIEVPGP